MLRIKQSQKFYHLAIGVIDDRKYDTDIRKYIGTAKDAFHKLNKVLRDWRILLADQHVSLFLCNI